VPSDRVYIRGAKDDVEKAKRRLLEVASDRVSDEFVKPLNSACMYIMPSVL